MFHTSWFFKKDYTDEAREGRCPLKRSLVFRGRFLFRKRVAVRRKSIIAVIAIHVNGAVMSDAVFACPGKTDRSREIIRIPVAGAQGGKKKNDHQIDGCTR